MTAEAATLEDVKKHGGPRVARHHPRLLIVDSAAATLEDTASRFARQGYVVETAAHAGDAQVILSQNDPDVVLLGLSAPADVDILRSLRTVDSTIPVILLTDGNDPALLRATRGLGVLGAIPKSMVPHDASVLRTLVEGHIEVLEPGLRVMEARALVGRSTVDLVARDAQESLVLVAVGLAADVQMFLQTVDLHAWCREHLDVVRRVFPAARVSPDRPPRILVAARRFTRFFCRGLEALRLPDVQCLTLRALDGPRLAAVPVHASEHRERCSGLDRGSSEPFLVTN